MDFFVMTLFPELIDSIADSSILKRAKDADIISVQAVNIRDYTEDKHGHVDDYCYGGGKGMLIKAQPVYDCCQAVEKNIGRKTRMIYMTPQGEVFTQKKAEELAKEEEQYYEDEYDDSDEDIDYDEFDEYYDDDDK